MNEVKAGSYKKNVYIALPLITLLLVGVALYFVSKLKKDEVPEPPNESKVKVLVTPRASDSAGIVSPAPRSGNIGDFMKRHIIIETGMIVHAGDFQSLENNNISILEDGKPIDFKVSDTLILGCYESEIEDTDSMNTTLVKNTSDSNPQSIGDILEKGDKVFLFLDENDNVGSVVVSSSKCPSE